jgi:hypothetical protein
MQTLKSQFVPYSLAKALKEKRFDVPCLAKYTRIPKDNIDTLLLEEQGVSKGVQIFGSCKNYNTKFYAKEGSISAPLWQQVIDWFRDEKYLDVMALPEGAKYTALVKSGTLHECVFYQENFTSFYPALTIAIEEALKLLP